MRWFIFSIAGLLFLSLGIVLLILAPNIPVYYVGGAMSINLGNGTVVPGSVTPSYYEILVPVTPNTLHMHLAGNKDLHVELSNPRGAVQAEWQSSVIAEDYVLSEVGLWTVYVSAPTVTNFQVELYTTASLTAHPLLVYASGSILLGTLSLLFSKNRRKLQSYLKDIVFEQNIGGRWIFAVWIPLFAFIARAPYFIPSYPWLYFTLIVLTVVAVFSCLSLAYIKLYVSIEGVLIEAPFMNFSRSYQSNQIYGFNVTEEKKQRWFLLRPIPSVRIRKEPSITITLLEPLPRRLQALVFGERFTGNTIKFRPKSVERFTSAMDKLGVLKRGTGRI